MNNNTIFDDVFRTNVEKMPQLVIPIINEAFHESFSEDEIIEQSRNEHQGEKGERITDSCLGIGDKLYHIECQSIPDATMVIRMVEYDFAIALERIDVSGEMCELKMPRSCVLYLRHNANTPNELRMKVVFSESVSVIYQVPVIKVKEYTKDEIFQKRLLMFLPFYIMRYEDKYKEIEENSKMFNNLIAEYDNIRVLLNELAINEEKSILYSDLIKLIKRISDYMLEEEKDLRERIGEIMGGHVLELESERIIREATEKGMAQGLEQGLEQGIERMGRLFNIMKSENRLEEFGNASVRPRDLEKLFKEYGL